MADKDDLRERLEQLAKWHEYERDVPDVASPAYRHHKIAAATLREVLAHPERLMGEPVAWMVRWSIPVDGYVIFRHNAVADYRGLHPEAESIPLYAPPQVKP